MGWPGSVDILSTSLKFERAIDQLRGFLWRQEVRWPKSDSCLLPRIALQVSRAVLPRYRSRFSKRQFTQPQLLAILCLMRYEDWTFREAEVRLSEHRELRQVLGLVSVPDFTTLYRFFATSRRPDHRPRGGRNGAPV